MALSNSRKKRGNLTIDELFKRPPQQQKKSSNEDEDLQLAMEMSQREHINEQKRLFEQYSLLSQRQFKPSTPSSATTTTMHTKNKRVIKMDPEEEEEEEERIENFTDDDDDDQWFQTVSIRPQQPPVKKTPSKPKPNPKPKLKQKEASKQKSKRHIPPPTSTSATASTFSMHNDTSNNNNNNTPIVKREDGDEILLDIDDLDEWLDAKTEKPEASDPALEITDLDAYLDSYQDDDEDMEQEPRSVITIDDQDDIPPPRHIPCPMCQKLFKPGREVQEHAAKCNNMISDTDSDCDIIDLINPANTVISKQTSSPPPSFAEAPVAQEEDEDDGYLSPLEGFTSIKNNQSEAFNPYFQQLQQPAPKPRKARTTRKSTTTTKRGGGRGRFRPYRRKKKS
ncbi:hypothetical protein V8B55DRAFT_1527817 [Mucor lusitanicus]|uniref:UBZ4-type domain-containing protein n=2 Tax=Mucor circinelloides f. lusitanicus TaxID=29924 RepID=A0A168IYE1_MUCCL|nr:hypothetical protein FB192DRAFT_1385178 [Mucor lusitanicus]OAD00515.1 hypothetical protein MUCCIDRAFT_113997 [Mucor lusitanicus CBS 277.49]